MRAIHGTCLGDVAMLSRSVALVEHLAAAGDKDGDVFVALLPEVKPGDTYRV